MIKHCLLTLLVSSLVSTPALAANKPMMAFKDLQISAIAADTFEITYKKDKAKIQRLDALRFKLNDQNVILDSSDTVEQIQNKMERAYRFSNKRSAALDEIFIPKAHAAPPMLFSMLFGGLMGFGLGRGSCDNNNNAGVAAEPAYVTPESAQ